MGYSCGALAGLVHEAMLVQLQASSSNDHKTGNTWDVRGVAHFDERGRENDDGAVTGTVYRMIPAGGDTFHARRVGGYRIEPNGKVTRWPTSTAANRATAEAVGRMKYIQTYGQAQYDAEQAHHAAV
jgi:hypothetical protein